MLEATERPRNKPLSFRSSVRNPTPRPIDWRGPRREIGSPSIEIAPHSTARAPNTASATSVRPEPTIPAIATISPSRTLKAHVLDPIAGARPVDRQHHLAFESASRDVAPENLFEPTPDHHVDHAVAGQRANRMRADQLPVL